MGAASSIPDQCDDGQITLMALGTEHEAQTAELIKNAPHDADGKVSKDYILSIVAPNKKLTMESGNMAATMGRRRRNSVMAMETDKAVDLADDADKASVCMSSITKDLASAQPEGGEFASWALSCCTELCMGNEVNRKTFVDNGCCEAITKYMELYPDDVFVQYQGMHALADLAGTPNAADKLGTRAMEMVIKALGNTDTAELGLAGLRALSQLVEFSPTCKAYHTADLVATLKSLMEDFKAMNQFVYRANELVRVLDAEQVLSNEELGSSEKKRLQAPANMAASMGRRRRNSVMAMETDKAVDIAPADQKAEVLSDSIAKDLETPEGGEFASWALSCCTELCRDETNRKKFVDRGCCEAINKYMELYSDDVFVQYQATLCIGTLGASGEAADKFGGATMEKIVQALSETDAAELAISCCMALRCLIDNSATCKAYNKADLIVAMKALQEDFSWLNNFVYSAGELVKTLEQD